MWINKLTTWKLLGQNLRSYTKIINWKNIVGIITWLTSPFQGYLWSSVITGDTTGCRCNLQQLTAESNQVYLITILHNLYFWLIFFLIKALVFKYPNWDNWNKLLWERLGMMKTMKIEETLCFLLLNNLLTYFVIKKALLTRTQSTSFYIQSIHWLRLTLSEFMTCQLYHCPPYGWRLKIHSSSSGVTLLKFDIYNIYKC